jgi:hypothetical protein
MNPRGADQSNPARRNATQADSLNAVPIKISKTLLDRHRIPRNVSG